MEKISRILPANARTQSVDVSKSQPVRPGAPSWGRPMGRVTPKTSLEIAPPAPQEIEDKIEFSDKALAGGTPDVEAKAPQNYKKIQEAAQIQKIQELSDKFFLEKPKEITQQTAPLSEQFAEEMSETQAG